MDLNRCFDIEKARKCKFYYDPPLPLKPYSVPEPMTLTPQKDFQICPSCGGKMVPTTCYRCDGKGFTFSKEVAEKILRSLEVYKR